MGIGAWGRFRGGVRLVSLSEGRGCVWMGANDFGGVVFETELVGIKGVTKDEL